MLIFNSVHELRFLKRAMGLSKHTPSRLVYVMARENFLIEETGWKHLLPKTEEVKEVIRKMKRKQEEIEEDFYTTEAVLNSTWKGVNQELRHVVVTRMSAHGFHSRVCKNDKYHEPSSERLTLLKMATERMKRMHQTSSLAQYEPLENFRYTLNNPLLSYEQRRFYEENGYIVIPGLVDDELIEKFRFSCSHGSLTALTVSPLLFNMAERQQLRLQVIGLIRAGHSASSAARTIGVPLATAKRWAKLFHENNEVSNRAIPGRPRISTREEDAILVTEAENHPFQSAFELKMASNFPGSPLTERRRLRERGIRSRQTATKEHLKIEHIVDRLAYATIRQDFDWRNVIFSDEVVVSSSNYGPPRVYRIDGHRYDERFVARLYKSGRKSYEKTQGYISISTEVRQFASSFQSTATLLASCSIPFEQESADS
ncbi:hypothetical protein C0J52_08460 [Blattella germanica]|nr:hypothetical protein C0J52_08460 [Blattella germanica]